MGTLWYDKVTLTALLQIGLFLGPQYLHCLWVIICFTVSVFENCIMLCWTSYAFHSQSLAIQAKQFYPAWLHVALRRRESWHGGYTEVLIVKSH